MLLFWDPFSICLTKHLPNTLVWIKWSSMTRVLTPVFSCDTLCFELFGKAGCCSVHPALCLCVLWRIPGTRSTLPAFIQALSSLKGHHPGSFVSLLMSVLMCRPCMWSIQRPGPFPAKWMCGGVCRSPLGPWRTAETQVHLHQSPASPLPSVAAALILSQVLPKTLLNKLPAPNYALRTYGPGTCVWIWRFQTSGVI